MIGDIFNTLFVGPVVNLLVLILQGLTFLHIPGALGFSIIILTILIRLLIWPFVASQMKSVKKMAEIKPELDELKEKHKQDKQALANAQMALYKEKGINPAGGCLPSLVQIPVILGLVNAIQNLFNGSAGLEVINRMLYSSAWRLNSSPDINFFGINLSIKPSDISQAGALFVIIPLITAALTFIQSKMMSPQPIKGYPGDKPKETNEKASADQSMAAVQSQMTYLMPIMVGYFAFQFPIGLALYWNTLTLLSIYQQYLIGGWGGLNGLVGLIKKLK